MVVVASCEPLVGCSHFLEASGCLLALTDMLQQLQLACYRVPVEYHAFALSQPLWEHIIMGNFIAFGSAPQKKADSQPISQLVRQAVSHAVSRASRQAGRQADRNTQFGFFNDGLGYKQWGAPCVPAYTAVEWKCTRPPTVRSAARLPADRRAC